MLSTHSECVTSGRPFGSSPDLVVSNPAVYCAAYEITYTTSAAAAAVRHVPTAD